MDICRELEQKYGLVPADQKQRREGLPLKKVEYEKGDVKHQIANVIRQVAKDYHFQSLKEYKALLSLYNTGVEEVRGEVKVKEYKGLIYSALNDKCGFRTIPAHNYRKKRAKKERKNADFMAETRPKTI